MKLPSWSYTSWAQYELCPFQYEAERVSKRFPFSESEHTRYGNRVHKELELRHKKGEPLKEATQHEPLMAKFDQFRGLSFVELKLTVNQQLKPTEWFAKDAFCRGIVDIGWKTGSTATLLDYKTGKIKEDSRQLKLFAALGFAHWPEVEVIENGFIWLKDKKKTTETVYRNQAQTIWSEFLPTVERIAESIETKIWPARKNGLCRNYCQVVDCPHHGT